MKAQRKTLLRGNETKFLAPLLCGLLAVSFGCTRESSATSQNTAAACPFSELQRSRAQLVMGMDPSSSTAGSSLSQPNSEEVPPAETTDPSVGTPALSLVGSLGGLGSLTGMFQNGQNPLAVADIANIIGVTGGQMGHGTQGDTQTASAPTDISQPDPLGSEGEQTSPEETSQVQQPPAPTQATQSFLGVNDAAQLANLMTCAAEGSSQNPISDLLAFCAINANQSCTAPSEKYARSIVLNAVGNPERAAQKWPDWVKEDKPIDQLAAYIESSGQVDISGVDLQNYMRTRKKICANRTTGTCAKYASPSAPEPSESSEPPASEATALEATQPTLAEQ